MVTLVNLRAYWRFFVVARQFLPLLFAYARDRRRYLLFGGPREVDAETRVRRAEHLLDSLLTLGPTFIKLGQLLSTRPDILPAEYIDVLASLQDDVPPADWDDARVVLEEELGPVAETFDEFDTDPISGASLGQVYRGRVQGTDVAVKVRRPGVESLVEADLRVIKWSLPILMRFVGQARAFSLENLADEFAKTIREEMDYGREARMLTEIRANFAEFDGVRIPAVLDDYSDARVLTMEYVGGTKINDVDRLDEQGIDRSEVAETLQETYLQMIIEDGVFHADPHPGNLAVTDDGTIVFYDFGMSGRVDEFVQDRIVEFYIAVASQDIDGILDSLIAIGTLSPEADRDVMGDVMELAIADARGDDIEQYRVNQIVGQIEDSIYEFPFRLPANLALVLRVATVVEGVCVTLDEDFDFISTATDYLTEQGYREESIKQYVEETGEQAWESAQSMLRVPPKLENTLDRAQRGNLTLQVELNDQKGVIDRLAKRIVYGLVFSFSMLATAYLYQGASLYAAGVSGAIGIIGGLLLWLSFRDKKGIRAQPQFTRQNMRKRRED
ncbi:ABC1 kinase family protein [Haloarchaeobius iranensis]|uniref:Predicted unusual protein kinase regulating ubiquinone biosynthesis, AarF/ABC1/UbiB family n=1 Tax=Haloarchaeobius iranensis TaxID=996166 RepID=A0A1G9X5H5_9EURY|nr:Predicted unusual protein kinase regulating ubiquinone biosynthesis, AarF/ABC1/UbiB family [Haloarchaeobius iranensis]